MYENVKRERFTVAVNTTDQISVERFYSKADGIPVLMVHGSVENGKIFYSSSGKGFAPFLADQGYDVFVMDMRGKGNSMPPVHSKSKYGQFEAITEDIPAVIERINTLKNHAPVHLVAHSFGGVILLAWYARFHSSASVRSMVFFGTKRKIYIKTWKKFFMVDIMWNLVGRSVSALVGYLPAKALRFGSDNEPRKFFLETNRWVYSDKWIEKRDQLNYHEVFKKLNLPPVLSLTGTDDHTLGNPRDVQQLLLESHVSDYRYVEVGKQHGFKHDYGHIDILTHPDAPNDHFKLVLDWMNEH